MEIGKEKEIKDGILRGYRRLNGCADTYRDLLRSRGVRGLAEIYVKNPDWCMELGFPAFGELKENFSDLEDMGIYVGKNLSSLKFDYKQVYIFHGCHGTVDVGMNLDDGIIPMLYFCNHCDVNLTCTSRYPMSIRVPIYSYGGNTITFTGNRQVDFVLYEYGVKGVKRENML